MTAYTRSADEAVGYHETIALDDQIPDYTGWTFAATFARFVGDPDAIALGMAADDDSDGWRIVDGPGRLVSLRIGGDTLQTYPDTSGRFTLFSNVLAAPPGQEPFHFCDMTIDVQKGPTTWPIS